MEITLDLMLCTVRSHKAPQKLPPVHVTLTDCHSGKAEMTSPGGGNNQTVQHSGERLKLKLSALVLVIVHFLLFKRQRQNGGERGPRANSGACQTVSISPSLPHDSSIHVPCLTRRHGVCTGWEITATLSTTGASNI